MYFLIGALARLLVTLAELRLMVTWNSSYMLSFMGSHTLPVFVHRAGTNPPTPIEAISMFPDMLVEVTVIQVCFS